MCRLDLSVVCLSVPKILDSEMTPTQLKALVESYGLDAIIAREIPRSAIFSARSRHESL